jgi:hypothetical protein
MTSGQQLPGTQSLIVHSDSQSKDKRSSTQETGTPKRSSNHPADEHAAPALMDLAKPNPE